GWDKHALNFFELAVDGKIDVLATVNDYYNLILSFQNWRRNKQIEFFRDELDDLSNLRKELRQKDQELRISQP
ncbi:MAG: hypothetical protein GX956_07205, partial [Firmicutes bacterium]|nr:hypothetical protein [Bacillota bacterium]